MFAQRICTGGCCCVRTDRDIFDSFPKVGQNRVVISNSQLMIRRLADANSRFGASGAGPEWQIIYVEAPMD